MIQKGIFYNTMNRKIFPYFFMIFLFFGFFLAGTFGTLYNLESKAYLERLEIVETANINLGLNLISTKLEAVVSDLMFLSRQNELRNFTDGNGDTEEIKRWISSEYLTFSREKRLYDQIRYIDGAGMELVRVNFNGGRPAVVAAQDLQSKADRYYFKDTMALAPNEIFMSPFDLNIEKGKIEIPRKPVIRFGVPIFDGKNRRRGVIILNYLGGELIAAIRESAKLSRGRVMLVNGDGYWLSGPDPEDEWGFMIPGRADRKFSSSYPEAWHTISAAGRCQIYTHSGLFTAATIYPLKEGTTSGPGATRAYGDNILSVRHDEYYWKIISLVPAEDLESGTRGLMTKLFLLAVSLLLLAAVPSWLIAQVLVRRRLHHMELHRSAHYDRLTKLPNRTLFMDRLAQTIKDAKRYGRGFALMFIDLDGFKSVNDTLGHAAGDALLVQTAVRLLTSLRESDTVARMGGDEFTVILPAVDSPISANRVAKKVIEVLNVPFEIHGHAPRVGASIGISLFPDDGTDVDILLKKADDAMYQVKKNGKNDYRFFKARF